MENLLDLVVPTAPGDVNIHTFSEFKDWINNQYNPKAALNSSSHFSKQTDIRPLRLKSSKTLIDEPKITHSHITKRLSIAFNQLNEIPENREQLEHSALDGAGEAAGGPGRSGIPGGGGNSMVRRASFGGGGLGFDLRENSVMGGSAQSSISVNGYQQINQYQLTKLLGKGSFADVYLGIDTQSPTSQKYAIKVLCSKKIRKRLLHKRSSQMLDRPPTPPADQDEQLPPEHESLADMFVRNQVAILKKMNNQYITKLHDVIIDNKQEKVYLVLEYCKGGYINQSRDSKDTYKKLMESQCKRYCRQLSQALDYIHNVAKIAHRDIKPENILLSEYDEVKLSDFGLGTHRINGKKSAGTPLYMPPDNSSKDVSNKAGDIWGLGVTLLVMLTGKHPEFKGQINPAVQIGKLKDVSDLCKDFIGRCLVVDSELRIKSEELAGHAWIESETLRQTAQNLQSIPSITVTAEERDNVLSDRKEKTGGESPVSFKIAII